MLATSILPTAQRLARPTPATRSPSTRPAPAATISRNTCCSRDHDQQHADDDLSRYSSAFDPKGDLVTYGSTTVDGNSGDSVLTYAPGSKGATLPEYAFAFSSPGLYYPGPSGLTVDSGGNVYLNGTFKNGFGSASGMYVAAAADIGNPAAQPARYIPWDKTTGLTAGRTTGVALDKSVEPFIGYFVESGSGTSATCQGAANVYAAGVKGGETDKPPLRTLTLDGVLTQGTDCTNSFSPLRFYYPSIAMYAGADLSWPMASTTRSPSTPRALTVT